MTKENIAKIVSDKEDAYIACEKLVDLVEKENMGLTETAYEKMKRALCIYALVRTRV